MSLEATWLRRIVDDAARDLTPVLPYLTLRGVTPQEAALHRLGYLPYEYEVERCDEEFARWQRRFLRGRVIFPLTNTVGHVIGLQTRSLTEKRYETYYSLGPELRVPVFGLEQSADAILYHEQVVLVEGPFDYFAVRRAGVVNVLAVLTARISRPLLTFLRRYVRTVVAFLDMDDAGRAGVERLRMVGAACGLTVIAPSYPAHDPADWVAAAGVVPLHTTLTSTQPLLL